MQLNLDLLPIPYLQKTTQQPHKNHTKTLQQPYNKPTSHLRTPSHPKCGAAVPALQPTRDRVFPPLAGAITAGTRLAGAEIVLLTRYHQQLQ